MANGVNPSEQFVAAHCDSTFLPLWGMANPLGRSPGKELCDYIVVCTPDVMIFSVKDVALAREAEAIAAERWVRKAVHKSVDQVYGAERALRDLDQVHDAKGRAIKLPDLGQRRLHRICVAFGSNGEISLPMGDFGRGFVHIMEERSFPILLRELDTISDLSAYLVHKAERVGLGCKTTCCGEEDLLALYLRGNRSLPAQWDRIVIADDCWKGLVETDEFRARREADRVSYAWDRVIEYVTSDLHKNDLLYVDPPNQAEKVLRAMAREDRFCRRFLAESLNEVLLGGRVSSRALQSLSGTAYVFLALNRGEDRQYRVAELAARCKIARGQFRDASTVVGIASERADDGARGLSFDLCLLEQADWTGDDQNEANWLREEFGFFKTPETSSKRLDEYPKQTGT